MPPTVALIKLNPQCLLSVRIFINRNSIIKGFTESKTIFEAPILSNNSILRLRSPSVKIHLSNEDMRSITDEIRNDLLFILYELCSSAIEEKILRKLRIGTFIEFNSVLQVYKDSFPVDSESGDQNDVAVGIDSNITTLHRIGKKKYKLHYSKKWELEIIIDDIEKLAHWRKLLILLESVDFKTNSNENILLLASKKTTNVLIRETKKERLESDDETRILVESDDDELDMILPENIDSGEQSTGKDVKPEIFYRYKGMRLLDKCIRINVLNRPKRI